MAVPAVVVLGCTLNTNCVAVPAVMLNAVLVPVTGPGALAVSVYPVPTLSIDRPVNVATPPDAAWVAVPDKAPPDGLVPIASVTLPVNPVTVFPFASWAVTSTAGAMLAPATRMGIQDRKSTRLNSSHTVISYAVFCLKKKK